MRRASAFVFGGACGGIGHTMASTTQAPYRRTPQSKPWTLLGLGRAEALITECMSLAAAGRGVTRIPRQPRREKALALQRPSIVMVGFCRIPAAARARAPSVIIRKREPEAMHAITLLHTGYRIEARGPAPSRRRSCPVESAAHVPDHGRLLPWRASSSREKLARPRRLMEDECPPQHARERQSLARGGRRKACARRSLS